MASIPEGGSGVDSRSLGPKVEPLQAGDSGPLGDTRLLVMNSLITSFAEILTKFCHPVQCAKVEEGRGEEEGSLGRPLNRLPRKRGGRRGSIRSIDCIEDYAAKGVRFAPSFASVFVLVFG